MYELLPENALNMQLKFKIILVGLHFFMMLFAILGINVSRSRFLPVKTCSDLLLIMSNLYNVSNGTLTMSPNRHFQTTPLVQLGEHFKKVSRLGIVFKYRF